MSDPPVVDVEKGQRQFSDPGPVPVAPPRKRSLLARVRVTLRRWYKKLGLKHVASLGIVVLYTLIGGLAFLATEYYSDLREHMDKYEQYIKVKDALPDRLYDTVVNCTNLNINNRNSCLNDIKTIIDEYETAIDVKPVSNTTVWDIWYSVYFACTIYTTIGYGDIYCKTVPGRLVTMLYALFGIPLLLTTLNDLGKAMFNLIHKLIRYNDKCTSFIVSFYHQYLGPKPPPTPDAEKIAPDSTIMYSTVEELSVTDESSPPSLHSEQMDKMGETHELKQIENENMIALNKDKIEVDEEEDEYEREIPVSLALVVTVGWIFGCAALFCVWETNWTYFESIYFFFISLTTIGLGDVTPDHPKYMIIAYGLVIVGLSLVSMCINVIQRKLEKLYYQLLQMILDEYTKQLSTGSNQLNATMGMMRMWNQSSKAKLIMPLLSKAKKELVAQKFQEEKKAEGIELPPVLAQMDKSTGMPVMFSVAEQEELEEPELFEVAVLESLQKAEALAVATQESVPDVALSEPEVAPRLAAVLYDASTETEKLSVEDKHEQTIIVEYFDEQVQTEVGATYLQVDDASQTLVIEHEVAEVQTINADTINDETQTTIITKKETSNQTLAVVSQDQELQTHLYDLTEQELQTDPPQTKNQRIQTPIPEMEDFTMQTDPVKERRTSVKPAHHTGSGFAATAKKKIRKALGKKDVKEKRRESKQLPGISASPSQPTMATWADVEGDLGSELGAEEEDEEEEEEEDLEEEEEEDLEWDPIDGMHAEKQKKVQDLKKMFEKPAGKYY